MSVFLQLLLSLFFVFFSSFASYRLCSCFVHCVVSSFFLLYHQLFLYVLLSVVIY